MRPRPPPPQCYARECGELHKVAAPQATQAGRGPPSIDRSAAVRAVARIFDQIGMARGALHGFVSGCTAGELA